MRSVAPAASIDIGALRHNLGCVRTAAPQAKVMAVIKANAYGHDVAICAAALDSADALAVARPAEGAALRERGFQRQVVVLEGAVSDEEVAACAHYRLDLVIHEPAQIDMLERYADDQERLSVWLKLDTGMNRLGFSAAEFPAALSRLQSMPSLDQPVNLMTHLANADLPADRMTDRQIQLFAGLTACHRGEASIANSAGLLAWPASRCDWVRPGLMLYGVSPFAGQTGTDLGLRAVMHFHSRLIAAKRIQTGATVGYGATWTASRDTTIGVVAAGYGDGYPGNLPSGTPVLINGSRLPMVGRVSMDMITIDLGAQPDARVGDAVTLWGPGLPVEEIAGLAERRSYELLCGVSRRVPRTIHDVDD